MQHTLKRKLTAGDRLKKLGQGIIQNRWLYALILPALVYLIIFNYLPMYGIQIAFKDYKAVRGIAGSPWTGMNGFKHFHTFFNAYYFGRLISNTLLLNVLGLIFTFPMPIALALIVNNIRSQRLKKFTQTAIYVPHFISTVVLAGILYILLSPTNGIVNHLITALGGKSVYFMNEASWFRPVYIISGIWQNAGWDSILYIAALAGVDPELYEAATIDGANKWQKVRYIDLPHIVPTATMMLILNSGTIIAVLSVYYGVAKWNDYWTGLIYLQTRSLLPLQTILKEILASLESSRELLMSMVSDTAAQDAELLNRAQIAKYCIIVVSTAPAVLLYLCMQKFFVKGVMIGSVKG